MTAWFTRPWGPSRPRGTGGQKVIKPVKPPPPPSTGEKKGWLPCPIVAALIPAVPTMAVLAACSALTNTGVIR